MAAGEGEVHVTRRSLPPRRRAATLGPRTHARVALMGALQQGHSSWTVRSHGGLRDEQDRRPHLRARRRGATRDGGRRLGRHPPRGHCRMAGRAAQRAAPGLLLALLDVDGLGPRAHLLLQRGLPARHAARQAPVGARATGQRGLGGDLGRGRAADRVGARDRRGHLGRGAPALPRAQRLPGGDLPHVLLQPARRGGRGHRRRALRRHRGHRARAGRASDGHVARPRRRRHGHPDARRGAGRDAAHRPRQPLGRAVRPGVPARARRVGAACRRDRRRAGPGDARAARGGRDRPVAGVDVARDRCGARRGPHRPGRAERGRRVAAAATGRRRRPVDHARRATSAGVPRGRPQPLPPLRRRLPRLRRAPGGPADLGAGQRRVPRGPTAARRVARRARPRQDRLLLQHQPRVPHTAHVDHGTGDGPVGRRAGRPGRAARDAGPGAPQRPAARTAGELAARLRPGRGRTGQGRARAARPRRADRRSRGHVPRRHRPGGPAAGGRLPAAAGPGLGRPGHVGEGRAQPALQRGEVHAGGWDHRAGAARRRRRRHRGRRHRHGHPRRGARRAVRAVPPGQRAEGPLGRGQRHRAGAGPRAGAAARRQHRGDLGTGPGEHVHGAGARGPRGRRHGRRHDARRRDPTRGWPRRTSPRR